MNYILFETAINFISSFFRLLFGLLIPLIMLLLGVSTVIDFTYLLLPSAGDLLDRTFDGNRFGGFRIMSKDALTSRERSITGEGNSLLIYLKLRLKTYICSAIVFLILLGFLPEIFSALLDYVFMILEKFGLWG